MVAHLFLGSAIFQLCLCITTYVLLPFEARRSHTKLTDVPLRAKAVLSRRVDEDSSTFIVFMTNPKAQNRPRALYSMVFGPKSLKI